MESGKKPTAYKELAMYLADRIGLSREYREFLIGPAGFRNILVQGYTTLNRELEEEAFRDIREYTPAIIEAIEAIIPSDPCIDDVVEAIRRIASKWSYIEYIILFGSIAGNGCGNDVDLAIKAKFHSGLDVGRFLMDLSSELKLPPEKIDIEVFNK